MTELFCAAAAVMSADVEALATFAVVLTALVCWLAMNAAKLCRAVRFYRDVKNAPNGEPEFTHAVIKGAWRRRRRRSSTAGAIAVYPNSGESAEVRMICDYDDILEKDQKVDIIVDRCSGELFALSVRQIKNAVLTYAVYTAVTLLLAAGGIIGIIISIMENR